MSRPKFGNVIISIFFMLLGFFLSGVIPFEKFKFDNNVDPLAGMSLVVSAIIAVYVSILFEGVKEKSKLRKELILRKADIFMGSIEEIRRLIISNDVDGDVLSYNLKRISQDFYSLKSLIGYAGYADSDFEQGFMGAYRAVREKTSQTEKNKASSCRDVKVVQGVFSYSSNRIREINEKFSLLMGFIIKEQMRVIDI